MITGSLFRKITVVFHLPFSLLSLTEIRRLLALLTIGMYSLPAYTAEYVIPNKKAGQARFHDGSAFHTELIEQALKYTDSTLGNFVSRPVTHSIPNSRIPESVIKDEELNVFWAAGTLEYQMPELFAIKIPLIKGLAGCRLLMESKDKPLSKERLVDYSALTFGLRHDWVAREIFEYNKLHIQTALNNKTLMLTLGAGRYDAIPVAADQIKNLLEANEGVAENFSVSELAIFQFPLPTIYYVNSNYPALAHALERGLIALKENGIFDSLIKKHFKYQLDILKNTKFATITLENPFLLKDLTITDSAC